MRIVPGADRLIRDPETRRQVDVVEGLIINPSDLYWARLLADGDAVEAPDAAVVPQMSAKKSTAPDAPSGER